MDEEFEAKNPLAGEGCWYIEYRPKGKTHPCNWVKNRDIWTDKECARQHRYPPASASFGTDEARAKAWAERLNKRGRRKWWLDKKRRV